MLAAHSSHGSVIRIQHIYIFFSYNTIIRFNDCFVSITNIIRISWPLAIGCCLPPIINISFILLSLWHEFSIHGHWTRLWAMNEGPLSIKSNKFFSVNFAWWWNSHKRMPCEGAKYGATIYSRKFEALMQNEWKVSVVAFIEIA